LTFNGEMLGLEVLFPIVGKTLVERNVLISGDVLWLSHPDWFGLVKSLVFVRNLLDLFGLFLLWFIIILDFWLIIFLFLVFLFIITCLSLNCGIDCTLNRLFIFLSIHFL